MNGGVEQLAIIGTGLLGASLGLAAKATGHAGRVVGYSRRQATVDEALARGAIDAGTTRLADAVAGSSLLVVAVPLGQMDATFKAIGEAMRRGGGGGGGGVVVTDVGSTKRSVLAAARTHLPEPARFVGSHPMAGSEQQGPAHADANLFNAKPCVVTPEPDTHPDAVQRVTALWRTLGMNVLCMTAATHDAHAATISHLPHAMAALLVAVAEQRGGWELASTGFRDTTRLASSNPPMRADILIANADEVRATFAAIRQRLDELDALLQAGDREGILTLLEACKAARDGWREPGWRGEPQMNTDEHR